MIWLLGLIWPALVMDGRAGMWELRVGERLLARESLESCRPTVLLADERSMTVACSLEKGARVADLRFVWDGRGERILSRTESPGWAGVGVSNGILLVSDGQREASWAYEGGRFRRVARGGKARAMAPVPKSIRLRQSSAAEFRRARPEAAKQGFVVLKEEIEAWQRLDGRIWWAKGFSDGEGARGVGGFGYLDELTGEVKTYSPRELVDWSVTAMVVERDSIWLGLVNHGEWGDGSGGVWRFDRISEEMERVSWRGTIVREMQRVGGDIVMATEWGAMVWDGSRLRRFAVDQRGELVEGR